MKRVLMSLVMGVMLVGLFSLAQAGGGEEGREGGGPQVQ